MLSKNKVRIAISLPKETITLIDKLKPLYPTLTKSEIIDCSLMLLAYSVINQHANELKNTEVKKGE